jgi:hypothetical protein
MVYLVHNRDPSAQLDQANTRDMDLLVADNFARAASLAGVKQIVYRTRLISNSPLGPDAAEVESEMYRVLASHGVPVTGLRTCLIVGSGGELIRLLIRIVRRLPLIPVPQLAQTMRRPISQADLMTAFRYCVGNPETFGKQYDVFGPEPVSLQRMLEETASVLGCERTFFPAPFLSERFLSLLLRMVCPSIHPDLLTYIIETFRSDTNGSENPVERAIARDAMMFRRTLETCIREEQKKKIEKEPDRRRQRNDEILRMTGRVRSIQRLKLPAGRNATWVAEQYYSWMGKLFQPILSTVRSADGSWTVLAHPGSINLLKLTFIPGHSSPDRRMYFITGGILAKILGGRTARLEFRDMLAGRLTLVAIHDFNPALPWIFYRVTHAVVHGLVMKRFQRHMERLANEA